MCVMSITIHLKPAQEDSLRRQAEAIGLSLEEYVLELLGRESSRETRYHPRVEESLITIEKFRGKIGPIPDSAVDAEMLYRSS